MYLNSSPHESVEPFLDIFDKFIDAGMKTYVPFTSDPRPMDFENNDPGPEKRASVAKQYPRIVVAVNSDPYYWSEKGFGLDIVKDYGASNFAKLL